VDLNALDRLSALVVVVFNAHAEPLGPLKLPPRHSHLSSHSVQNERKDMYVREMVTSILAWFTQRKEIFSSFD
jgi:hypothetical protein